MRIREDSLWVRVQGPNGDACSIEVWVDGISREHLRQNISIWLHSVPPFAGTVVPANGGGRFSKAIVAWPS